LNSGGWDDFSEGENQAETLTAQAGFYAGLAVFFVPCDEKAPFAMIMD
jgi:hypothetical protein